MSLDEKFKEASEEVKNLAGRPSNQELLELYACFKQATTGDNETKKPGMLNLKDRAKWDAWNELKGTDANAAMEKYTSLVDSLKDQHGTK